MARWWWLVVVFGAALIREGIIWLGYSWVTGTIVATDSRRESDFDPKLTLAECQLSTQNGN